MNNQIQTTYAYEDENGAILFKKKRVEPIDGDGKSKTFYYEREENGQLIRNTEGCRKILYHLPQVLNAISKNLPIYLVEGEKDADNLLSRGLVATTAPVTSVWHESFTQTLKNADVVLLFDYDKAGIKRKNLIVNSLTGNVKRLRVIDLPGIEYSESHGKDITDWLSMGNTIDQLTDIVQSTAEYIAPIEQNLDIQKGSLKLITVDELISLELPEREIILHPFLPNQGLVMLAAKRGVGKTHVALGIAYAVASGGSFLKWKAPTAKKVLYIDGEMPAVLMKERLNIVAEISDSKPEDQALLFITPDLQDKAMPNLSSQEGRDIIDEYTKDRDLIILDNLSCLFKTGGENEAESWQDTQEWLLDLRRRGKSVLFAHHIGKNGTQRGTSKKEDALDTTLILKHPEDYKTTEGARFEVHYDKARHFTGEDAESFLAHLTKENGKHSWHISRSADEERLQHIADMRATGYTIQAMCDKTGLTKSQIETLITKAKALNLIK